MTFRFGQFHSCFGRLGRQMLEINCRRCNPMQAQLKATTYSPVRGTYRTDIGYREGQMKPQDGTER